MAEKSGDPMFEFFANNELKEWTIVKGRKSAGGGQGTVVQVRNNENGAIGALKTLHNEHLGSLERRYRMQQEVYLLNLLNSNGVPKVLLDNVESWRTRGEPLYAIIEWVEGPTLADFCNGRPKPIDVAVSITCALLDIVQRCHAAGVLHRDIKPDNIILRNGSINDPVLIDFGMGWASCDEMKFGEFATGEGQELGNRFLRLPENAPGHHVRDSRSDVTMLVAILFFILTGQAPRVLLDPNGRMPQEAMLERLPKSTIGDIRWERLQRIFKVGFQQRLDMRYIDVQQLADSLAALSHSPDPYMESPLDKQLRRLNALTASADGLILEQCQNNALSALRKFFNNFMTRIKEFGFEAGGQGPVISERGHVAKTTLSLSKIGVAVPQVRFVVQISFENGLFQASYGLINEDIAQTLYEGPLADPVTLSDAVSNSVDEILAVLIEKYVNALSEHI